MTTTIYQERGYSGRKDYLKTLAEDFGIPFSVVAEVAGMLGPNEDFDGLISSLDDYAEFYMD